MRAGIVGGIAGVGRIAEGQGLGLNSPLFHNRTGIGQYRSMKATGKCWYLEITYSQIGKE